MTPEELKVNLKLTERDRLVLTKSLVMLVWFGLLCRAISYSIWLGLAVSILLSTHGAFRRYLDR
jgi:hypothetical protein